jgi:prepilin-type N-terminal cleavage/methylation domain-containing protein
MGKRVLTREGGFTLAEVLIAMVIMAVVMVGMQAALTQRLTGDLRLQDTRSAAIHLAADRLRTVQLDPVYGSLGARYAATETSVPGYPGYQRVTQVTQTVADGNDYTTVTVKVTHPRLAQPVTRSLVIAAP